MIGKKLRSLRRARGLSQKELTKKLSVSLRAYKNWEEDISDPELKNLIIIADYFHITIDDLLNRDTGEQISTGSLSEADLLKLKAIVQVFKDYIEK